MLGTDGAQVQPVSRPPCMHDVIVPSSAYSRFEFVGTRKPLEIRFRTPVAAGSRKGSLHNCDGNSWQAMQCMQETVNSTVA